VRPDRRAGAVAILAAFMLLTLMAGVALATTRNLLRELPMAGPWLGEAEAAAAAESGLAWFLAWSAGEAGLQVLDAGQEKVLAPPPGLLPAAPGSPFRQGFRLRIRPLGALAGPGGEAGAPELWLVTATGHSAAEGQDRPFLQVRELVVAVPAASPGPGGPGQEPARGLRILAWRAEIPSL